MVAILICFLGTDVILAAYLAKLCFLSKPAGTLPADIHRQLMADRPSIIHRLAIPELHTQFAKEVQTRKIQGRL
jgi:hypothetical protein